MDLIIRKGITLYDVCFEKEGDRTWVRDMSSKMLITGFDNTLFSLCEVVPGVFELKEVE